MKEQQFNGTGGCARGQLSTLAAIVSARCFRAKTSSSDRHLTVNKFLKVGCWGSTGFVQNRLFQRRPRGAVPPDRRRRARLQDRLELRRVYG